MDRLTLASGGVARDFLAIFRKAVDVARERGEDYRGVDIGSKTLMWRPGSMNLPAVESGSGIRSKIKLKLRSNSQRMDYFLP